MEVLTFNQFAWKYGFDVEISHDRLRYPHGISKAQARSNHKAATHHLLEAFRAAFAYQKAIDEGQVRPPTEEETHLGTLRGHPDNQAVLASWRVSIKRLQRRNPTMKTKDTLIATLKSMLPAEPTALKTPCVFYGVTYTSFDINVLRGNEEGFEVLPLDNLNVEQLCEVVDAIK